MQTLDQIIKELDLLKRDIQKIKISQLTKSSLDKLQVAPTVNGESLITKEEVDKLISEIPVTDIPETNVVESQIGNTWLKSNSISSTWSSIAMSASGKYQLVVNDNEHDSIYIYTSNDYGNTWVYTNLPSFFWTSVAVSASGKYQSICGQGSIYRSIDFGITWESTYVSNKRFSDISISSSGQYQSTCSDGYIYVSNDYGETWTDTNTPNNSWQSISISSSGQYQSVVGDGQIYISNNYGVTWIYTSAPSLDWKCITISSSGQYQSIIAFNIIYISNNYGVTWTDTSAPSGNWKSIAMSASGKYQSACIYGGTIYNSNDYGITWISTNTSNARWKSIAISASGQYQSASAMYNNIYISNTPELMVSGIIINNTTSNPENPIAGQISYNSTDGEIEYYNGVSWVRDSKILYGIGIPNDTTNNGTFYVNTDSLYIYLNGSWNKISPTNSNQLPFADFFGLMPPDNMSTISPGSDVNFPQDGPTDSSGNIIRIDSSSFKLVNIGIYEVNFQVSVSEAGQLILTLDGEDLAYTVVGRATGTSQIVGTCLIQTSNINSTLTVRNPVGNSTALTITPLAGGTRPVSCHIVIKQLS